MQCDESFNYIGYVPERCYSLSAMCNAPPEPTTDTIKTTHVKDHVYVGGDTITCVSYIV